MFDHGCYNILHLTLKDNSVMSRKVYILTSYSKLMLNEPMVVSHICMNY